MGPLYSSIEKSGVNVVGGVGPPPAFKARLILIHGTGSDRLDLDEPVQGFEDGGLAEPPLRLFEIAFAEARLLVPPDPGEDRPIDTSGLIQEPAADRRPDPREMTLVVVDPLPGG